MNATHLPRFWILLQMVSAFVVSAATHTLTVNVNGSGTVATNPVAAVYPHNSTVTLTASPTAGWQFSGWSGDINGTLNPTNVLMDADKVITADFWQIPSYTLTVNVSGAGSVAPNGGTFLSNSLVQLNATASNGWVFDHWSGDASGNANPESVTMASRKSITAVFIQPVSITVQPHDVTAAPGTSTNFTVSATGTGPLSYSWLFNGSPIEGASSTFILNNVQLGNAGQYRAIVKSPYGSATSSIATLVVSCPGTNVITVPTDAALRAAVAVGGNVRLCFNGTVTLTNTIPVAKDTWLDAAGVNVVVSGGHTSRLFTVASNVIFSITNLGLINGSYTDTNFSPSGGGAILSTGTLQLTSCLLSNNFVRDGNGGGIACLGGSLMVTNCRFVGNVGRGSVALSQQESANGGAIFLGDSATAVISDSLFLSNSLASDSTSTLPGAESTAQLSGGALAVLTATCTVTRVQFLTNGVFGGFTRNGTPTPVGGGSVYNRGSMMVRDCSFLGNEVSASSGFTSVGIGSRGGAMSITGSAVIVGSTFVGNKCRGGAGRVVSFPYFPGTDAAGGAVESSGTVSMTNCTFTLNSAIGGASGDGGAPRGNALGGAIYGGSSALSLTLVNVTIASNSVILAAYYGGGAMLGANIAVTNYSVTVRNSLFAHPGTNVWGIVADGGFNISSDGSANFSSGTSFNFTDPKLLPLANNGGPTLTMALAPDSPAIDWVPAANAPAADQRGVIRPFGVAADIGAFEVGAPAPWLSVKRSGNSVELSFPVWAGIPYRIEHSTTLPVWQLYESLGIVPTNGTIIRTITTSAAAESFRAVSY